MTTVFRFVPVLLLVSGIATAQNSIEFVTADSLRIYGDIYEAEVVDPPVILLFHQAGANGPAEYGTIIQRLLDAGYSVVRSINAQAEVASADRTGPLRH